MKDAPVQTARRGQGILVHEAAGIPSRAAVRMKPSVLQALTIAAVYELAVQGRAIRRFGRSALVRCPVNEHEDRHPSCLLDETRNRWRCLSCGAKGGMLDCVIAAGHAVDRAGAARWLEVRLP